MAETGMWGQTPARYNSDITRVLVTAASILSFPIAIDILPSVRSVRAWDIDR
jgi:hypothetical protein